MLSLGGQIMEVDPLSLEFPWRMLTKRERIFRVIVWGMVVAVWGVIIWFSFM